jgi:hypothetical protein
MGWLFSRDGRIEGAFKNVFEPTSPILKISNIGGSMKHFTSEEKLVVYDAQVEKLLEKSLLFLSEARGSVENCASLFMAHRKTLEEDLGDEYKGYISKVEKILKDPHYALDSLKILVGPEERSDLESAREISPSVVPDTVLGEMISIPGMRALTRTTAGLCLSLLVGYTIDANAGITYGLRGTNQALYTMVKDIWENAIEDLHPFQRGPTHQGTKHCSQLLDNLDALRKQLRLSWDLEIRALLHIAAALHDIGKGDIIANVTDHAQKGAKIIRNHPQTFGLDDKCSDFVAQTVETHNPEDPIKGIRTLGALDINAPNLNINIPGVEMKNICAIFQLADVMDITRERVSGPIFEILTSLYELSAVPDEKQAYDKIKTIVRGRKGVKRVEIVTGTDAHVKIEKSLDPSFHKDVDERIKVENEDLRKTEAYSVLKDHKPDRWPCELRS